MNTDGHIEQPASDDKVILLATTVDMSNIFYEGIVQFLHDEGWEVHLLSGAGRVGKELSGEGAIRHSLKMERGLSPLRDIASLIQWVRTLRKVRPDVLVMGTPKASLLGGISAKLTRVNKVIYVVHGLRAERTTGLLGKLLNTVEFVTLSTADHIIAVSSSLRDAIVHTHPKFKDRIEVLGFGSLNGVDLDRFAIPTNEQRQVAKTQLGLPESKFVVGFVGRLHRDKGGDFLVKLLQNKSFEKLGLHLLIIGDVEDESLQSEIERLGREGRLTLTGWVENPEAPLQSIDVLLHPTRREGLGMSLLEAQAMGFPVITNRVTGTTDAVEEGVGGSFAMLDSVQSWVREIEMLRKDPQLRETMGRNGRSFVADRFARTAVVKRFVSYLDSI